MTTLLLFSMFLIGSHSWRQLTWVWYQAFPLCNAGVRKIGLNTELLTSCNIYFHLCPCSLCDRARSQPMIKDATYVTPSLPLDKKMMEMSHSSFIAIGYYTYGYHNNGAHQPNPYKISYNHIYVSYKKVVCRSFHATQGAKASVAMMISI